MSSEDTKSSWSISSYKNFPIKQQPSYTDSSQVEQQLTILRSLPPLVHHNEIENLKQQLAQAARGERFLLQGGDCAERFQDCGKQPIEAKLKIILQMSLVISYLAHIPTIRVGRVAGQYGKPRSSPTEKAPDGTEIASFKGDNINGYEPTQESRKHDPSRLVTAHFYSACTINYIRALIKGGYADLHHSRHWDLGGVADLSKRTKYQEIANSIIDSLTFMDAVGIRQHRVRDVDFFTSHEGLVLDYEAAVTKKINHQYYNTGAHFLWIGNRTRDINGAHIEYFRGIANPIGIKVDAAIEPTHLVELVKKLNPTNEAGKITLITRFGAEQIKTALAACIQAIKAAGLIVVWSCDPMHGNTYTTKDGVKTRNFDHILAEIVNTFKVHTENGSHLGGVHFELTGENVTECVGGPQNLLEKNLSLRYTTYCDPRMNYLQSMEMSFLVANLLSESRPQSKRSTSPTTGSDVDDDDCLDTSD